MGLMTWEGNGGLENGDHCTSPCPIPCLPWEASLSPHGL